MLTAEQRLIVAARTRLRLADIVRLSQPDEQGWRGELDALLSVLAEELPELSDLLARSYFSHADTGSRSSQPEFDRGRAP